jgi:hypothetical protein
MGLVKAGLGTAALKAVFAAFVTMGVLGAGQAQAVVVNVNGQNWNVTTFTGSYNDNTSKFNTAANGGIMPWWGGAPDLASSFAVAVGSSLGTQVIDTFTLGPLFARTFAGDLLRTRVTFAPGFDQDFFGADVSVANRGTSYLWAQAELATVPGPLPALGAVAAFGFSRKLRQRIKVSKAVGASFPAA